MKRVHKQLQGLAFGPIQTCLYLTGHLQQVPVKEIPAGTSACP